MKRIMLNSKIHRATITGADIAYVGSITIDPNLMKAANIFPGEQVHVLDIDNGARFETYVIEGEPASGELVVNGAAARLVSPGDKAIVLSYVLVDDEEAAGHRPTLVLVDDENSPTDGEVA